MTPKKKNADERSSEKTTLKKKTFQDYIIEHDFPSIGKKKMMLNASKLFKEEEEEEMILLAIEDITGRGHEKA